MSTPVQIVDRLDDTIAELQVLNFALQHPEVQDDIVEPVRITLFNAVGRLRSLRNAVEGGES